MNTVGLIKEPQNSMNTEKIPPMTPRPPLPAGFQILQNG